jgi:exo-beta-1,3-glucanase (GH17 family)/cellulose synthase/poly-beta-1,6-N-acetylglucosamine synthase-like glycosyltransferase
MRKFSYVVLGLIVAANLAVWAWTNRPQSVESWEGTIKGASFSPYQKGQDPYAQTYPSPEEIDRDLEIVKQKVGSIRTYSTANGFEVIPYLARNHKLRMTAGAWLDKRYTQNEVEIKNLILNAQVFNNIDRLIVGNEVILRQDLTVDELSWYLNRVRAATSLPVSTAEPWHVWIKHPELAEAVDFITIHVLPYWERVPADQAVDWVIERVKQVEDFFPDKKVIIGEVGWPSHGSRFGKSKPSLANQAMFIRTFLNVAAERKLDYFVMEAIDQTWKRTAEGNVGRYWGILDSDRRDKFPMSGEITEVALWPWEAVISALLGLVPMILFLMYWQNLKARGQLFYAALIQLVTSVLTWTAFVPFTMSLTMADQILWCVLLPAQVALLIVVLINGLELTEVLWMKRLGRLFTPLSQEPERGFPKVSIHVPTHNEPPDMVIQTLEALGRLDYPDYEVLVIDNNTEDESLWRPVEAWCANFGERFRFFHLPEWPGFKAGALNFALSQTHPEAQVVGVVDSDYIVAENWLKTLIPYFDRPEVGFVQAPQDNRDWQADPFKQMCNWEYSGFFQIGMVQRNEYDAIIQHGTMTLIRKAAMFQAGTWSEWCICEDAEMGLRILELGYESVYVNHDFGRGLVPDTFAGYKSQRFRWAYGAVQILKRHWRQLLPWSHSRLDLRQRYHFAAGWFPWFADALHLLFTIAGVAWSMGMIVFPQYMEFPMVSFLVPVLCVFFYKVIHSLILYQARVKCTLLQRLGASVAGMSLTHTIAKAIFLGLRTSDRPFMRTPKQQNQPLIVQGLMMASEEIKLLVLLWLAAFAILFRYGADNADAITWLLVLAVQSLSYMAAVASSLVNIAPQLRRLKPIANLADAMRFGRRAIGN